jgi:hypothetical protein
MKLSETKCSRFTLEQHDIRFDTYKDISHDYAPSRFEPFTSVELGYGEWHR